jgi:thiol-disulfide isomerase/thioredoxin
VLHRNQAGDKFSPSSGLEFVTKLSEYRVVIAGILSPLATVAVLVCFGVYAEHSNGWLFGVLGRAFGVMLLLAMTAPFLVTAFLAIRDHGRHTLSLSAEIGLVIAVLSLGLPAMFVRGVVTDWKQSRNMAMHDVPAPAFKTLDLDGNTQSLGDQKGKVVLVNVWATWCVFCLDEMPKLDRLYQEHNRDGLIVFGLSPEDAAVQRKGLKAIRVTYPLLTYAGQVPPIYRDITGWPTTFVIDRRGRLQPALSGDQPFEKLEATALAVLNRKPD